MLGDRPYKASAGYSVTAGVCKTCLGNPTAMFRQARRKWNNSDSWEEVEAVGIGLIFWILMLIWLAFTLWYSWPLTPGNPALPQSLFLFILLLLLGWGVFGAPIRG